MEIKKSKYLYVDTRGQRQQRQNRTTPEAHSVNNQLRDSADSFEALLARRRQSRTDSLSDSLYLTQMQAQKSALMDEYASTLARLSHDFSRQLGSNSLHLSEIIDHAETPDRLNTLLANLDAATRLSTEQFIQSHHVQIHSLNLKGREIKDFPSTLQSWLEQQHIPPAYSDNTLKTHTANNNDAERYQQISGQYQNYLQQLKADHTQAANALLMAAQKSSNGAELSLAGIVAALDTPAAERAPALNAWLDEQQQLVEQFSHSRERQQQQLSLADWARQQGLSHPWLHT